MRNILIFAIVACFCSCINETNNGRVSPYGVSMDNTIEVFIDSLCNSDMDIKIIDPVGFDHESERYTATLSAEIEGGFDMVMTIDATPKSRKVFLVLVEVQLPEISDTALIDCYYGCVAGTIYAQEMLPNAKDTPNKFYYNGKYYETFGGYTSEIEECFNLDIDDCYNAVFEKKNAAIWVRLLSDSRCIWTAFSDKPNLRLYNNEVSDANKTNK